MGMNACDCSLENIAHPCPQPFLSYLIFDCLLHEVENYFYNLIEDNLHSRAF